MWFDDQKHSVQVSPFCSPWLDSLGVLFECLLFPWRVLPALVISCVVMCGILSAPFCICIVRCLKYCLHVRVTLIVWLCGFCFVAAWLIVAQLYSLLKEISDDTQNWRIRVRVARLWEHRDENREERQWVVEAAFSGGRWKGMSVFSSVRAKYHSI